MNCRNCLESLLVADPRAIALALANRAEDAPDSPRSTDPLDHLSACDSCRLAARRILDEQAKLAAQLEALRPNRLLPDSVSAARREAVHRRIRRRRYVWASAAAAVAGLLGIRALDPGIDAGTDEGGVSARQTSLPMGTEVEALLDESVVVLETENENVVVFWFYQGRGE